MEKSSQASLTVDRLSFSFPEKKVLSELSLCLNPGEFVTLLGRNGSGKTVLLKLIASLLSPDAGSIRFRTRSHLPVSIALQNAPLFPWLTLEENLLICMNDGQSSAQKTARCRELLDLAKLSHARDYFPTQCSGGMQQKLNVLRCFGNESDVILMDEPFVYLDQIQKIELQEFLSHLCREKGKSVLFVTHDMDEAIYLSNRILLLSAQSRSISVDIPNTRKRFANLAEMRSAPDYQRIFSELSTRLRAEEGCL